MNDSDLEFEVLSSRSSLFIFCVTLGTQVKSCIKLFTFSYNWKNNIVLKVTPSSYNHHYHFYLLSTSWSFHIGSDMHNFMVKTMFRAKTMFLHAMCPRSSKSLLFRKKDSSFLLNSDCWRNSLLHHLLSGYYFSLPPQVSALPTLPHCPTADVWARKAYIILCNLYPLFFAAKVFHLLRLKG